MSIVAVRCTQKPAPSIEDVLAYENKDLIERLMEKMSLTQPKAQALKDDMLRFLYLCGTNNEHFAPPETIDEAWHHFILFTKDYAVFCKRYFGSFIHHSPNSSEKEIERGIMKKTLRRGYDLFGPLSHFWGTDGLSDCVGGSCSSDCTQCSGSTNCQN